MKKFLAIPAVLLMTSAAFAGGHIPAPPVAPSVSGSFNHTTNTTNVNKASISQSITGAYTASGKNSAAGGNTQVGVITQQSPIGGF